MRVLVVDDSLTIRSLIRRTLTQLVQGQTDEAVNGLDALAQISRHRYDLVVLDVNMPVMDGVEALEVIRTTPEYAELPVVMLTGETSEAQVRRLVELRITDFLSKPLSSDALSERLQRVLTRLREQSPTRGVTDAHGSGHRVLVIDRDPDRRNFLLNALAGHYRAVDADSAAAGLQTCVAETQDPFDVVLVGAQVGLPSVDRFIPKMRSVPGMASARLIACIHRGVPLDESRRALFEEVIECSSVPEIFLADLVRVLTGAQTPLARILLIRPSLAKDTVTATEQTFGLMLSCEVEASMAAPARRHSWNGPGVFATIDQRTDDDALLTLAYRSDVSTAKLIASKMIGVEPDDILEQDFLATAAELVNIVHGGLRNRLVDAGIHAQLMLPKTWAGEDEEPSADDPDAIGIVFTTPTADISFELVLTARALPPPAA